MTRMTISRTSSQAVRNRRQTFSGQCLVSDAAYRVNSGLAVQNPDEGGSGSGGTGLINDILRRAAEYAQHILEL